MKIFKEPLEFQWDKGNIGKSLKKHKVEDKEVEETFFDKHHRRFKDKIHSKGEQRYQIVGKTKKGRLLFIVFTMRTRKIRIISARDINKREVYLYEKET